MKKFILLFLFFKSAFLFSQGVSSSSEYVFIYFKDKGNISSFYTNPLSELTQKALNRRTNLGIALDDRDAPINSAYVNDLAATLGLVNIKSQSKWLNGVAIDITAAQKQIILAKPYVLNIESFAKTNSILIRQSQQNSLIRNNKKESFNKLGTEDLFANNNIKNDKLFSISTTYNYGNAAMQIAQVNIDKLHIKGYTGTGIAIAILDCGFRYVNVGLAYANLRNNNRIKDTYNFIGDESYTVYDPIQITNPHGANVLGIMAGYLNNTTDNLYFAGSAPDADYYLYATEDASNFNSGNDYPEEEMNFIRALERADKMGVDIATASLGYVDFGDSRYNYTNADMTGFKSFVARGSNIAAEKGIIVMIAQGNEGNRSWHYVTSPADSPNVFSVGSVDSAGNSSVFTSYGIETLNFVKPDASAMGTSTYYTNSSYNAVASTAISSGSGTSYAVPIASGGLACMLQILPKNMPRNEIKNYMRATASTYPSYDYRKGYGILNFDNSLTALLNVNKIKKHSLLKIYPNPVKNAVTIKTDDNLQSIELYDKSGRKILNLPISTTQNLENLPKGLYYLKIKTDKSTEVEKIIKE